MLNASFAPWSKLYKKSFIDYNDFRFDLNVAFDDVPFHVKTLLEASKISFVPEFFYHYRLSNPNSVNNTKSNQIDIMRICNIVERFLKEFNYFDEFKQEFYEFKIRQIMNYIISCNYEEYYNLAKEEFIKMELGDVNLSQNLLKDYDDVLSTTSYDEFRVKRGAPSLNTVSSDVPKVSLIVPVYNTENYVSSCLDSLINQSLMDIEIICIDDGSTDNSLSVLRKYEKLDSRVKVISKPNAGAGSARNLGLKHAKGEYINFVDSDDWLDLNALEELYIKSKNDNLDILMYLLINYDDSTEELYETDYYNLSCIDSKFDNKVFNYKDISDDMFDLAVSPCNKLIKREFWNSLNYEFCEGVMFEDNPFFFKVFLGAKRVAITRKYYYYRRRRKNSVMELNGEKLMDIMDMTDNVVDVFFEKNLQEQFKVRLTNFKFYSIKTFYNKINSDSKNSYFECMKDNFNKIRSNETLFKLFDSGLYVDTKRWFNLALIANDHSEFDFLLENDISDLISMSKDLNFYKNQFSNQQIINKKLSSEKLKLMGEVKKLNIENIHNIEKIDYLNKFNKHLNDEIFKFTVQKNSNRSFLKNLKKR